jgi:hypothetical protein
MRIANQTFTPFLFLHWCQAVHETGSGKFVGCIFAAPSGMTIRQHCRLQLSRHLRRGAPATTGTRNSAAGRPGQAQSLEGVPWVARRWHAGWRVRDLLLKKRHAHERSVTWMSSVCMTLWIRLLS